MLSVARLQASSGLLLPGLAGISRDPCLAGGGRNLAVLRVGEFDGRDIGASATPLTVGLHPGPMAASVDRVIKQAAAPPTHTSGPFAESARKMALSATFTGRHVLPESIECWSWPSEEIVQRLSSGLKRKNSERSLPVDFSRAAASSLAAGAASPPTSRAVRLRPWPAQPPRLSALHLLLSPWPGQPHRSLPFVS